MTTPMNKKIVRKMSGQHVEDPNSITANIYNEAVGAQKNMEMGHHLRPVNIDGTSYTTDLTTAVGVGSGKTLAVYNNSNTLYSITLGTDPTVTSLSSGAVSGDNAGIPCKTNDWTYIALYDKPFAIAENVALLCFVVEDPTYVSDQNNPVR